MNTVPAVSPADASALAALRLAVADIRAARIAQGAAEAASELAGRLLLRRYALTVDAEFPGAGSRILEPGEMWRAVDGEAADAMYAEWWADGLCAAGRAGVAVQNAERAAVALAGSSAATLADLPAEGDAWEAWAMLALVGAVAA